MKKVIIYISLFALLTTSLAACKTDKNNNPETTTQDITLSDLVQAPSETVNIINSDEILTPASQGIITPNENVKLGDDIKLAYETANPNFENTEASKPYVQFDEVRYYYEKKEDSNSSVNAVYKIVQYKEGYGFSCGFTSMNDVLNSLGAQEAALEPIENLYFLLSKNDNTYSLTYPAGENILKFYFTDDTLVAVLLEFHE